jgi:membrane protease YdiL (CAAX protease family)
MGCGKETENGLLGWATNGKTVNPEGRRLRDTHLAYVTAWLEVSFALAEWYCCTAIVRIIMLNIVLPFFRSSQDVVGDDFKSKEHGTIVGRIVECLLISWILLWISARHFRSSLYTHAAASGLTWQPAWRPIASIKIVGLVATFHGIGTCCVWLADQALLPATASRQERLLGLANYSRWGIEGAVEVLMLVPFKEELLFRASLLMRLENRAPSHPRASAAVAAAIFAIVHLTNLAHAAYSPFYVALQVSTAGLVGYCLSLQYLNRRCLWEVFACHMSNNLAGSFLPVDVVVGRAFRPHAADGDNEDAAAPHFHQSLLVFVGFTATMAFYWRRICTETSILRCKTMRKEPEGDSLSGTSPAISSDTPTSLLEHLKKN